MKWKILTVIFFLTTVVLLLTLPDNVKWLGGPYQPTTQEEIDRNRQDILDTADEVEHGVVRLRGTGFGSGFVVHRDGYIFTNAHVVGNDRKMKVITRGGEEYNASVVAVADKQRVDFAILKAQEPRNTTVLDIGNSSTVEEGNLVFNIGHPVQFYSYTIIAGEVVSNRAGPINSDNGGIRVDKPGGSGQSGSPLFNLDGEVIGIVATGIPPHDEWTQIDDQDQIVIWKENYDQYRSRDLTGADRTQRMYRFTKQELGEETADQIFDG